MLRQLVLASACLLAPLTAKAAPAIFCGQARADLRVCVSSAGFPGRPAVDSLYLTYTTGEEAYVSNLQITRGEADGITWYWGDAVVHGEPMQVWLRVARVGTTATAELLYRDVAGEPWQLVPGTGSFAF
jgi:hypothetical protein